MYIIFDVTTSKWSFDGGCEDGGRSVRMDFMFRDDGCLPVVFRLMRFGYKVGGWRQTFPVIGQYYATNQKILATVIVPLEPGQTYPLSVWCENAGERILGQHEIVTPPGPAPVPHYDRLKIVDAVDGLGKAEDFERMLGEASARVRLRWQSAVTLAGDDLDFLDMVEVMQVRWEMSDEQVKELLRKCEA